MSKQVKVFVGAPGEYKRGKTQLDGSTPFLFLFQQVEIYPGQGFDERGFTLVDVARCPENNVLHGKGDVYGCGIVVKVGDWRPADRQRSPRPEAKTSV